jgi:hypothetical protein
MGSPQDRFHLALVSQPGCEWSFGLCIDARERERERD